MKGLMMSRDEKARRFLELHRPGAPLIMPNIWSAGSAMAIAEAGYEALATTSGGIALDMGVEDGSVGRAASLAKAGAICAAVDLPVSADLENCFHDEPKQCAQTMLDAAKVGLAGASIEDASGRSQDPIYAFDHAVERVRQAVEAARSSGSFVVTARAENFLHGRPDLEDTIARLKAFEAVGADVLFAPGLPDADAIRTVCAALSRPVSVIVYPYDTGFSAKAAAAAGAARISLAGSLARIARTAIIDAADTVRSQLHG